MKARIATLVLAGVFALSSAGIVLASNYVNCTVDKVDGDKVTMTCKSADKLKAGAKVKVKAAKKKAIEGC